MSIAIITGSAGLVGGEAVRLFSRRGLDVIGIDNDLRSRFFGAEASTRWNRERLEETISGYRHLDRDIRDRDAIDDLFRRHGNAIEVVVHTAAQPSHDWAAREPFTDFSVNATGTLNLLEATRRHAPEAVFIFTSTNKVYGDRPNHLPLVERETRWELDPEHPWAEHGFDESMSIDQCLHSLFGASKVAADVMVQEYGRYFDLRTACFRGGCLTGPTHAGTRLHGFLSYLMRCALTGQHYTVFGYGGKQVRDNIHSEDLVEAFWQFFRAPRIGEVYNIGGGRASNCSLREAVALCEEITGRPMDIEYTDDHRVGDHIWWISDIRRFQDHYPEWTLTHDVPAILQQIHDHLAERLDSGTKQEAGHGGGR